MKLYELLEENPGEEITVWDENYDLECYFYGGVIDDKGNDEWDTAMYQLAKKLEVVSTEIKDNRTIATVNLSQIVENNLDGLEKADLFINCDIDDIMENMANILSGNVSENWLTDFVEALTRTDERFSEHSTFSEEEERSDDKPALFDINEEDDPDYYEVQELAEQEAATDRQTVREKLKKEIFEAIERAFRASWESPNYFSVYIDFDTGRPYTNEELSLSEMPMSVYFGKDFGIYNCGGNPELYDPVIYDDNYLGNLESWLNDYERSKYNEWLQSDEFKELEENDESEDKDECEQAKIEWIKTNTNAHKALYEYARDEELAEFAYEADEIAEDAINTWEKAIKEEAEGTDEGEAPIFQRAR